MEEKRNVPGRDGSEVTATIEAVAAAIESGEVSTNDARTLGNALAEAIKKGDLEMRAGTKVVAAIRESRKRQRKPREPKEPDNFYRLARKQAEVIDGLTVWADGQMKPETREEKTYAKAVIAGAANLLIQYARLGIDIQGIYGTFISPRANGDR